MKIDLWEGGSRVPFIVSWPGKIPAGTSSDQLLGFTDMMATFASIVGDIETDPAQFDSYDLSPVFLNENYSVPVRRELVIQDKIFRKDNYKLILGTGLGSLSKRFDNEGFYLSEQDNSGELYDLGNDLTENVNLYEKEPELVNTLKTEFDEIMKVVYSPEKGSELPHK